MASVNLLIGTRKGAFVAESSLERKQWSVRGPYMGGQSIMHMAFDKRSGATLAASGDPWFGSRVYRSTDMGHNWEEPTASPSFPEDSGLKLEKVWQVEPGRPEEPGVVYAGVEPAGLFKSTDDGRTWSWIKSLNDHPTAKDRWFPSAGGLCLHTIILDPSDPQRMYVAISAGGLYASSDGGASWAPHNQGVRTNFTPDQPPEYPEAGQCVHKVGLNPARPELLYQQNHCGVYRSEDRGKNWTEVTGDLPSDWGHGLALHPHDPNTFYVTQGISGYEHWFPKGQMAVYRTRDGGAKWQALTNGLPGNAYLHILREGLTTDDQQSVGVYAGTNTGQLFYSTNEGDRWEQMPALFPPISSITAFSA